MAASRNPGRAAPPDRDRSASDAPVESAAGTDDDPLDRFGDAPDPDRPDETGAGDAAGADPLDLFGGGPDIDLLDDDDDVSASDLDLPDDGPAAGGTPAAAATAGTGDADAADFARSFEPRWCDGVIEDDISMPVDVDETDLAALRATAAGGQTGGPARDLRDIGLLDALLADGEEPIDLTRDMRADRDDGDDDVFLLGPDAMPVPPPAAGGWNWLTSPWAYGVVAGMLALAGYELFMDGSSAWVYRIY